MRELIGVLGSGQQMRFGIFRHFIGLVDAGKVLDIAGQRAPVQALRITRDTFCERRIRTMSAIISKADIHWHDPHVRFVPEADKAHLSGCDCLQGCRSSFP
jgi:hypothetical protein